MSTYLDVKTGRWFYSKAELLAYQRGEGLSSPRSVSKPKKTESKPAEPVEEKAEPEEIQEEPAEESQDPILDKDFEGMVKEAMSKSLEEITTELKDRFGVDGRTLRWASEESLNQMYLDRMKATWKARHNQE